MSEPQNPSSKQSSTRIIRLADFSELGELFSSWQGRFEQISSGRFEGALHVVSGGLVRIVGITANQRVLLRGHDASGMVSVFPVTNRNSESLWQGRRLIPGHLVLDGVDAETDHYSARQTDYQGASLHRPVLLEVAKALLSNDELALPKNWTAVAPQPEHFARLCQQFALLLNQGIADPALLGTPDGERLEQECVRSIVTAMFGATGPHQVLSLPARAVIFRRAEEYMRSRLGDPVGAIDICRQLGVSDRTLRLTFRERVGLGPMAYFKCLRLNAVRARLRAAPGGTIADVAMEFGFHHAGNFASDYRRLFRERPSETISNVSDGQHHHADS